MSDLTDDVVRSWSGTPDPRLREVMTSLTRHLHAFVEEVGLTQQEWEHAVGYLTRVGQACDEARQEFILLSDVLGVSMLVDEIDHGTPAGATESTVLGPFHVVDSPPRALGDDISLDGVGDPVVVAGRVRDLEGRPAAGRERSTCGRPAPTGSTTCSSPTCSPSATCVDCHGGRRRR